MAAVDAAAAALALRPGMALADARAMVPALRVADADPGADAALLICIVDWCRRFTPLAALDGSDGVLLDIGGVAHLFGGEAGLLEAVDRGLRHQGFAAGGSIASTPEAAWALARFSTVKIAPALPDTETERLVADLPVAALRLEEATVRSMAQAGLRRIGDIMLRPRAPITARFGPLPFGRLDALLGRTRSSISPRFEAPAYLAERRFASGLAQQGDIEAAMLPLARHLCALLSRNREGARRIEVSLFRVDGVVKRLTVGTGRPTRDPDTIMGLFRERIAGLGEDGLDTGYGFDLIRLGVVSAETLNPVQDGLTTDRDAFGEADLADLADRLGARLGVHRVLCVEDHGTHIPEFAVVALPAAQRRMPDTGSGSGSIEPDAVPCRPIRLFERPEPITTIAAVPDGPPVRFSWRRITHEIAAIEGPERISPEWWHGEPGLTRDYFRAEDREGRRYWLFREGLFNQETDQARWFLHGLFG